MKTINSFILIALLIGMKNCIKDENDEINLETNTTSILVKYDKY